MATPFKFRVTTTAGAPATTSGMIANEIIVNSRDGTISFLNAAGTAVIKLDQATCQATAV
jgi:hypothetical protein